MGAPSDLQPGDHPFAVDGIPLGSQDLTSLASRWYAGNTVEYTVERGGSEVEVAVPLVQWQPQAALSL